MLDLLTPVVLRLGFLLAAFFGLLLLLVLPLRLDGLSSELKVFVGVEEFLADFLVLFLVSVVPLLNRCLFWVLYFFT